MTRFLKLAALTLFAAPALALPGLGGVFDDPTCMRDYEQEVMGIAYEYELWAEDVRAEFRAIVAQYGGPGQMDPQMRQAMRMERDSILAFIAQERDAHLRDLESQLCPDCQDLNGDGICDDECYDEQGMWTCECDDYDGDGICDSCYDDQGNEVECSLF